MTAEEKVRRLAEFVKKIERLDVGSYDAFSLDDVRCECPECGETCTPTWPSGARECTEYVDERVLDDIKDQAWHVLADTETL